MMAAFIGLGCSLQDLSGLQGGPLEDAGGIGPSGGSGGDGGSGGGPETPPTDAPLTNGTFEGTYAPWEVVGNCTLALSTDTPHAGDTCLFVSNRTQAWEGVGHNLLGRATPGESYQVTAWVRSADSDQTANLTYKHLCSAQTGDGTFTQIRSQGISQTWTELTGILRIPDECTLVASIVYVEGPLPGKAFYVDDVSMIRLANP